MVYPTYQYDMVAATKVFYQTSAATKVFYQTSAATSAYQALLALLYPSLAAIIAALAVASLTYFVPSFKQCGISSLYKMFSFRRLGL